MLRGEDLVYEFGFFLGDVKGYVRDTVERSHGVEIAHHNFAEKEKKSRKYARVDVMCEEWIEDINGSIVCLPTHMSLP